MIYQSYAKTDVYCNASLRNKRQKQKQKENSDVAGNWKPLIKSQKCNAPLTDT